MNTSDNWPILTFFSNAVRLFVALATLVAFFVGWQFIQARAHVAKGEPLVTHKLDMDTIRKEYEQKDKVLPPVVKELVIVHNEGLPITVPLGGLDFLVMFGVCPQGRDGWELFLERARPTWCENWEEERLRFEQEWLKWGSTEDWLELELRGECRRFYEFRQLIENNRELINIVREKFESGQPPGACSTSLGLAMTGELDNQELAFAADTLEQSEFVVVDMEIANDGNAVAPRVRIVAKEEGFECEDPQGGETGQCGPFDLEVGERRTVRFTAQPGRFLDRSDHEIAGMFTLEGGQAEVVDRARILGLLTRAGLFTAAIIATDVTWKLRRNLVEQSPCWGCILLILAFVALWVLVLWAIIGFARGLVI